MQRRIPMAAVPAQSSPQSGRTLREIEQAIAESRAILNLGENWDGEGAAAYTEGPWRRATEFLLRHATYLFKELGVVIEAPVIGPGPDGGIDLHWKTDHFEMLLNFPKEAGDRATFYGDDYGSIYIKGTLDPSAYHHGLLLWLKSNR